MGGIGEGLGDGIDGFEIMPDFEEVTVFGSGQTIGNDFVGTFYDLKRSRNGRFYGIGWDACSEVIEQFARSGFDKTKLARYYRSPKQLYATSFMVPTVRSSTAPKAFGEHDTGGWCWIVHYEGKLVHSEGIKFRFRGQGDDVLLVRVDGKIVLNASWPGTEQRLTPEWQSFNGDNRVYRMGNNYAVVGDWITLEPGVPLEMEVVGGEVPGGHFDMMLVVEEEGIDYPLSDNGAPIYPMFKTTEPSHDLRDAIYEWLVPGEASVTNGPVFRDFSMAAASETPAPEPDEEMIETVLEAQGPRTWTLNSGQTVDADFLSYVGDKIALKTAAGKQVKIDLADFSEEDQRYVELSNPPQFNIDFTKKSTQRMVQVTPHLNEVAPRVFDWKFGARAKQSSPRAYKHPLRMEYFAVGQQVLDTDKYILLDRGNSTFVPTKENDRSHQFMGDRITEMINYELHTQERGERYKGYLILIWDERGEIIQYAASNDWLYENREDLMEIPVGRFFDKTCKRVHPTGPKRYY
jgi:hypothetical protein